IHKDGDGDASFQLESNSLPHAHAQTTKTYYKHQDSRIMKAQELKTKTSAQTLIYKIFLQRYQVEFKRISLTGFRSCTSRSRYRSISKQTTRLIHIESRKPPTAELFDVDSGRISIVTVNTKDYHSDVLAIITRIMRRTLDSSLWT
ncbi:hypothetical protein Tco_0808008, partial [Tanacetum coccineum]